MSEAGRGAAAAVNELEGERKGITAAARCDRLSYRRSAPPYLYWDYFFETFLIYGIPTIGSGRERAGGALCVRLPVR